VAPDGEILFKQIGPFTPESLETKLLPAIEKALAPEGS
jgi:cytochrome c biogenesis protein CcmG/thiol:disulfide interchange protein DsbE